MSTDLFTFTYDLAGLDRNELLAEVASRAQTLQGHFGSDTAVAADAGFRVLMEDQARFARDVEVYPLTSQTFLDAKRPAPVDLADLTRDFRYYFVRIPVGLMPARNWAFNRLEVRVEFTTSSGEPQMLPRAYQVLPDARFQTLLSSDLGMEVHLTEKLQFEAKVAAAPMISAGGSVSVAPAFNAVLGPFRYQIKRAEIQNSGTGLEWVFWRIEGTRFFQEDRPELIVIAQVPIASKDVAIRGVLQAYRSFAFGGAGLLDIARGLPASLQSFVHGGLPVRDEQQWPITSKL